MNVRKRLQLNAAASALTVLVVALVLWAGLHRIDQALQQLDLSDQILKGTFERYSLLQDYLMTDNPRTQQQWLGEHAQLREILSRAAEKFKASEDQKVIAEMRDDHEATGRLFAGIVENRQNRRSAERPAELSKAIENRYLTQITIRLYGKISKIEELRSAARQRVFFEVEQTGGGIVVLLIVAALLAGAGSWSLSRAVAGPIGKLKESLSRIGQGDFEHRIDLPGNDELADFSRAFNAMTEKLQTTYDDLQKQIIERRRAEQQLLALNETLEQRVSERTALAEGRSRQLQALAVELIEAEEQERRRIAQLLHDDLQQLLAAAKMQLQAASSCPPGEGLMNDIGQILEESIDKTRRLSHELSPAVLHHSGLQAGLEWLCRQMNEQFGLLTELHDETATLLGSTPVTVFLFRAVQELLFNVVKHAGANNARIHLARANATISVSVADQGRGFDPASLGGVSDKIGFGLLTIKERAQNMGGGLSIESAPGKGSRFTVSVPWREEKN